MKREALAATRYLRIAEPQTPEERERVETLLRLALAAAQRVRSEETSREAEMPPVSRKPS